MINNEPNYQWYSFFFSTLSLPQPPHVTVLIREKAVGVITTILHIIKSAAVDSSSGASRFGAGESVHKRPVSAVVTAAFSAHAAAAGDERKKEEEEGGGGNNNNNPTHLLSVD